MSDDGTPVEHDDEPQARPDWLERIAYFMKPRAAGRIVLVHSGADARLRELVLSLLRTAPDLRVLARASAVLDAPSGAAIILVPRDDDFAWLNHARPVFEQRALRVLLWCDRDTVGRLLVRAPDFMHWVSHAVVGPRGVPAFAASGIRCALRARARGIAWRGPRLDESFHAALPGRRLQRMSALGSLLERAAAVHAAGASWVVWSDADSEDQVAFAERVLALARRRTRAILVEPAGTPLGFWPLHAGTMVFSQACQALEEAGAARPGRLAVLADLEPEAITLLVELLRARVPEIAIEPELLRAEDPGAEVARTALERGLVRREDVLEGRRCEAPLLRALSRVRARVTPLVPFATAASEDVLRRALQLKGDTALFQPVVGTSRIELTILEGEGANAAGIADIGRHAIALLLREAMRFDRESRYPDVLRAAEKAREGAKEIGDIGLEVWAASLEATALKRLGRMSEALALHSWILSIAEDPAHRAAVAPDGVAFEVVTAFSSWAESALALPEFQVDRLFQVLDAGDRFVVAIGKPHWRAGLLWMRARVLQQLGRVEEAIGFAEEGLALRLRDRMGPGASVGAQRCGLGNLLLQTGRFDEAGSLFQTVLDGAESSMYDRFFALRGRHALALVAGDAVAARTYADEAVRLAEPMGDDALSLALKNLTDACLAQPDLAAARHASDRHLAVARRLGIAARLFDALQGAARVALAEGDLTRARALLAEAHPFAEALDHARSRNLYRALLGELGKQLAELERGHAAGGR